PRTTYTVSLPRWNRYPRAPSFRELQSRENADAAHVLAGCHYHTFAFSGRQPAEPLVKQAARARNIRGGHRRPRHKRISTARVQSFDTHAAGVKVGTSHAVINPR